MEKFVVYNGEKILYQLEYKKVKNINLRIKPDRAVHVSANKRVKIEVIENFILSKGEFILRALKKYDMQKSIPLKKYFSESEICEVIKNIAQNVHPYYEKLGIEYPVIKFRKMVSQWGNCYPKKGVLTFNINLMYAPLECIEYVVYHEFTHFLQANHSKLFYSELKKVCSDWEEKRKKLKNIPIR